MIDIKKLDHDRKIDLIKFLYLVEFAGAENKKKTIRRPDLIRIINVVTLIQDGVNVEDGKLDEILGIFKAYLPELKTEQGQQDIGFEKRFGLYCENRVLYLARMDHLGRTGGGEVVSFNKTKI